MARFIRQFALRRLRDAAPWRFAHTLAISLAGALVISTASATPPPQRSLEIPPIIDPSRTAVLSGFVPLKAPEPKSKEGADSDREPGSPTQREAASPSADEEVRLPVVWVVAPPGTRTSAGPEQVMVVQGAAFVPTTVVVSPGTPVALRTTESGVRQVRGEGSLRVDRRLTRATRATPVTLDRTGAVDLTVREEPSAKGVIVCVESPFSAVATRDGSFRIIGLPPGRRQVRIRLPDGKILEKSVELVAGREHTVDWRKD